MTPSLLLALATFSFIGSVTPGPNNIMLMASGAAFGGVTPDEVIDQLLAQVPVPRDRA